MTIQKEGQQGEATVCQKERTYSVCLQETQEVNVAAGEGIRRVALCGAWPVGDKQTSQERRSETPLVEGSSCQEHRGVQKAQLAYSCRLGREASGPGSSWGLWMHSFCFLGILLHASTRFSQLHSGYKPRDNPLTVSLRL